ncbi:MAG: MFS transporter [Muribaculaceae bacterium]|nr:MFS transporter [Muribaculaceae bacterium]
MNNQTAAATARKSTMAQMIPVMLCFFAMGFVDLVGTATNYVQKDLGLSEASASIFPSLVFFWFLIFSVPTGMLMNKIGRKKTVLLSLAVTFISLLIPLFGESYMIMLLSFSFLGIGNAIMQTSLNPLVTNLISRDKLASTLTFGQFVKALASFSATLIAPWGAATAMMTFGLNWRILFLIYAVICLLSLAALGATPIHEEKPDKVSGIGECVRLLGRPFILLCFIGIMCHVGIDVGTNTYAPKVISERLGLALNEAIFGTTVYFICRTAGCFLGAFILRMMPPRSFFLISVLLMAAGMVILMTCHDLTMLFTGIGLIGVGNSNIFSVVFSQALIAAPAERNEVSGLMIMGLFGGTIFPLGMGAAAGAVGQLGSIIVMSAGVLYLLVYTMKIKNQ